MLPAGEAVAALRVAVINAHPATRIGLETILSSSGITLALSCASVGEALSRLPEARCDAALVGSPADAATLDAVRRLGATRVPVVVLGGEDAVGALRAGAAGHVGLDASPARIVAALQAAAAGLFVAEPAVLAALAGIERPVAAPMAGATEHPATTMDSRARSLAERRAIPERRSVPDRRGLPDRRDESAERSAERERTALDDAVGRLGDADTRDVLSTRELELLRHLAEGYTNKEIARVMVLAEDTVKKAVQALIAKLGAADRTHAVVLALRRGLMD